MTDDLRARLETLIASTPYLIGKNCYVVTVHDIEAALSAVPAPLPAATAPYDDLPTMADAAEMLWIVLANVSGGDWTQQTPDWQEAAARWRDNYFAAVQREQGRPAAPASAWTGLMAGCAPAATDRTTTNSGDVGGPTEPS